MIATMFRFLESVPQGGQESFFALLFSRQRGAGQSEIRFPTPSATDTYIVYFPAVTFLPERFLSMNSITDAQTALRSNPLK